MQGNVDWSKDQSNEIERIQKRALKIIYKEDDYDKCLQTAELVSLKERRDQMCIQLIMCIQLKFLDNSNVISFWIFSDLDFIHYIIPMIVFRSLVIVPIGVTYYSYN